MAKGMQSTESTYDLGEVHFAGQELGLETIAEVEVPHTDLETLADLGLISYAEARGAGVSGISVSRVATKSALQQGRTYESSEDKLNARFVPPVRSTGTSKQKRRIRTADRRAEHPNLQ